MGPDNNSRGDRIITSITKAGGGLLKIGGIALLVYVVSMSIFAILKYSTTKSTLLSYGISDATGTLIAWAVMFIAIGIPGLAIIRLFIFRGRPYDYAVAMILPLISWGIAQIPANFDAQTGKALRYCSYRPDNSLFCLDRPGIDPLTQKKLVPMNPSLAELEFRKDRGLAPKRIAQPVANMVFFDPLTAQPKVWVHKNDQGCFDMFDNPGVDPQSGDPLSPITKEAVRLIKECEKKALRDQEHVRAYAAVPFGNEKKRPDATFQRSEIPLASAPLSSWPKLVIPANGKSGRISVPPEMHVITTDEVGSRLHNVYQDGSECVEACTDGPLAGVYITNDSGKEITISYSFAHK